MENILNETKLISKEQIDKNKTQPIKKELKKMDSNISEEKESNQPNEDNDNKNDKKDKV